MWLMEFCIFASCDLLYNAVCFARTSTEFGQRDIRIGKGHIHACTLARSHGKLS